MICSVGASTASGCQLAAGVIGFPVGAIVLLPALLLRQAFGGRHYGRVYAIANVGLALGIGFGPGVVGWLHDAAGGSGPAAWCLGPAPAAAAVAILPGRRGRRGPFPGMTFAPRCSPDGTQVVLSLSQDGNTDLFMMRLADRQLRRLTNNPAIDTSASFSPDGSQLAFESDRGGSQQLYIMPANGGPAQRISFGQGNYGTPVWSPRGDTIAFTKILSGRFHIGVMRTDGTDERLLSSSFLDEGPTFSPNGRVIAFFRESPGQTGRAQLMSIDVTGRNLRVVETPNAASDPAWSPVRR